MKFTAQTPPSGPQRRNVSLGQSHIPSESYVIISCFLHNHQLLLSPQTSHCLPVVLGRSALTSEGVHCSRAWRDRVFHQLSILDWRKCRDFAKNQTLCYFVQNQSCTIQGKTFHEVKLSQILAKSQKLWTLNLAQNFPLYGMNLMDFKIVLQRTGHSQSKGPSSVHHWKAQHPTGPSKIEDLSILFCSFVLMFQTIDTSSILHEPEPKDLPSSARTLTQQLHWLTVNAVHTNRALTCKLTYLCM